MSTINLKRLRLTAGKCSVTLQDTGAVILRTARGYRTADSLRETASLLRPADSPFGDADRAALRTLVDKVKAVSALVCDA